MEQLQRWILKRVKKGEVKLKGETVEMVEEQESSCGHRVYLRKIIKRRIAHLNAAVKENDSVRAHCVIYTFENAAN